MINLNGEFFDSSLNENRGFLYGDAVFETIKILNRKILFLEDHYFRLMMAMRVIRMEIPSFFTMEYFEEQIILTATQNGLATSARVRITVYRNNGGYYLPQTNEISFLIQTSPLASELYFVEKQDYEVDLYKDFYVSKQLLSNIKTTNKIINVTASIYANENKLDNCILLNESKNVVEVINGNLFMICEDKLITPKLTEGCINGIMRKQILALVKKAKSFDVIEAVISPFDLQKADELFLTNVIKGIQPITKYRGKKFSSTKSDVLLKEINELILQN